MDEWRAEVDKTYVVTVLTEDMSWVAETIGPFSNLDEAQRYIVRHDLRGRAAAGFIGEREPDPPFERAVFDFEQSIGRWVVTVEQLEAERDPITSAKDFERAARNVCGRVSEGCRDAEVS